MASKKFDKGSPEWNMFQDYWKLCQANWMVQDTDEYWENLVSSIDEFYKKHKNVPLAKRLGMALADEKDEESKKMGKRR